MDNNDSRAELYRYLSNLKMRSGISTSLEQTELTTVFPIDDCYRRTDIFINIPNKKLESIKNVLEKNIAKLTLTSYRGQIYTDVVFRPVTQNVLVKYGLYKRPGFDQAYNSYKKMAPNTTESEFARARIGDNSPTVFNYNSQLVEARIAADNSDSDFGFGYKFDEIPAALTRIVIQIYNPDLAPNLEKIKEILQLFC